MVGKTSARTMHALCIAAALAGAAATSATSAHAQTANESAAQVRFGRGRELFVANDFNGALVEFRAANQLVGSPNTRLYIARCLRELGRLGEAFIEFQRAAAEAADRSSSEPRYAATRDAARQDMEAIRPRIGNLTLRAPRAPEGLVVRVGDTVVPNAMLDVPVPTTPGTIVVTASATGRLPFRQEITVRAGANAEQSIELRPDPNYVAPAVGSGNNGNNGNGNGANGRDGESATPPPPRMVRVTEGGGVRIAGIVVGGLGVAGLAAFVGFGLRASARFVSLQTECGLGGCGPEWNPQIQEGQLFQTLANVGLIAGSALVVGGTVMLIVGGPRERMVPESEAAGRSTARRAAPQWTPWVAPGAGGAMAGIGATF